jgi:hypothetical protein
MPLRDSRASSPERNSGCRRLADRSPGIQAATARRSGADRRPWLTDCGCAVHMRAPASPTPISPELTRSPCSAEQGGQANSERRPATCARSRRSTAPYVTGLTDIPARAKSCAASTSSPVRLPNTVHARPSCNRSVTQCWHWPAGHSIIQRPIDPSAPRPAASPDRPEHGS